MADKNRYRIVISSLGVNANRTLLALNRDFQHGIARTRELFSSGSHEFFDGDACEVWRKAQYLRGHDVPFVIEPPFPYDLVTYDPARDTNTIGDQKMETEPNKAMEPTPVNGTVRLAHGPRQVSVSLILRVRHSNPL